MKHAREDYARFQDPAAEPEFYELIGTLARLIEEEAADQEIAEAVVDVLSGSSALSQAREFAARVTLPTGSTPVGADEPVFLIRGQDICASGAVRFYASLAQADSPEVAAKAREWASEIDCWQEFTGRCKRPDLPQGGDRDA